MESGEQRDYYAMTKAVARQRADRVRPYVKCPKCGLLQALQFARIHWPAGCTPGEALTRASYSCKKCGGEIRDCDKPRLNALYTHSFGEVAAVFLGIGKENPEALRFFVETWLDEEWIEPAGSIETPAE